MTRRRLALTLAAGGGWIAVVVLRLVYLQVTCHDHYAGLAGRQQQLVVELSSPRGTLYDARGRPLAMSVPVDSAYAEPRLVEDPRATARALARVLPGADAGELAATLSKDRSWVWVVRKLDQPQARALRRLDLPGIGFVEETKRYYPHRELAAAVLGFVGTDDHGLAGLEQRFDRQVAGRPVRRTLLRDARQSTAAPPEQSWVEAKPGKDLHLTLDLTLQHVVEQELARAVEERGARSASAVLLDPGTGAVLAMASHPGFDPNRFQRFAESRWRNRAVQDAYEPGSTFKVFTAAAALAANVIDPGDVLDCQMGETWVDGRRIRDHKRFGRLSFREVIAKSSNVGAIQTGLRVGGGRLGAMIEAFGFGRPTGIDLPGENPGLVHPMGDRDRLATAYVSFGQGLSLTPLQLATAFASIANGGRLLRPYVVAAVGDGPPRAPEELGRPLPEGTVRELERLLEAVVTAEGTGKTARIPGYRVAGKTGTAQTAEDGGYSATRYIASFAGFAPARSPRLVAVVVIDEPRLPVYHGGQVAAPVFRAIVERALLYLDVPPQAPDGEIPSIAPPATREAGRRVAALAPPGGPSARRPGDPGNPREELASSRAAGLPAPGGAGP